MSWLILTDSGSYTLRQKRSNTSSLSCSAEAPMPCEASASAVKSGVLSQVVTGCHRLPQDLSFRFERFWKAAHEPIDKMNSK